MTRKLISTLIILATLSVVGIVITQIYWLDKAFKVQKTQYDLRLQQERAEAKQFNDRVSIALGNVANEILSINNDPAQVFQAVQQIRPNYFRVAINDTVHPYLLESLLMREFGRRNIDENFEYGVYDCFTDSIVYGNFVPFSEDSVSTRASRTAPEIKWDRDGHYFSVFFPDRTSTIVDPVQPQVATWAFSAIILLIVFVFFAYAIFVIIRQKRLSEMKTDFINNMTHELKTPISTISLSSEVLLRPNISAEPEKLKQYASIIQAENLRLRNQVDRVLQLAALDTNRQTLKLEPIDLHTLIRNASLPAQVNTEARGGSLKLELNANEHQVFGDEMHLINVIANLLDNAIKYSPDPPEICIATSSNAEYIEVSVADKGIGIPENALPHIFEKFYRVPKGNLHDVKGFGIGLYYVYLIIEGHNGKISAKSQPGGGSIFTFNLPLQHDHSN